VNKTEFTVVTTAD